MSVGNDVVAAELSQPIITGSGSSRRYSNPWPEWKSKTFWDFLRWQRQCPPHSERARTWLRGNKHPQAADFAAAFPVATPDAQMLAAPPEEAVQATWIGHSTCLVQMEGQTFLTDPVFAERAGPLPFLGPRRLVAPALTVAQLPHVDAVLISHNHFDHLCSQSVQALLKRFGPRLAWFVPLGLASWFHSAGAKSNVHELGWWQDAAVDSPAGPAAIRVTATPAQHWSIRIGGKNASLWCGWALSGRRHRVWFAGDTGYCSVFKEIGRHLGPFDLALIPIGAYDPTWFLAEQHVDPRQAVQVHQDVRSRRSIGIHTCTFSLADEALDEPPAALQQEAKLAGLAADAFTVLQHGAVLQTAHGQDLNSPARIMPAPEGMAAHQAA